MIKENPSHSRYWIDGRVSCPIGGPFDLWRWNHFRDYGKTPEDTVKMYPSLSPETVDILAVATVNERRSLAQVLVDFAEHGPELELRLAHNYFREWRRPSPFMPESMKGIPSRPARSTPEPLHEFLDDWENHSH